MINIKNASLFTFPHQRWDELYAEGALGSQAPSRGSPVVEYGKCQKGVLNSVGTNANTDQPSFGFSQSDLLSFFCIPYSHIHQRKLPSPSYLSPAL